jgi:type IV secretory pathway VirB2 component (pilin)
MSINRSRLIVFAHVLVATFLMPALALAEGGGPGLMWESSFETILESVKAIGYTLLIVGIIITGVKLATSEGGGIGGKAVGLVLGGGLVLGASEFVSTVFEGSSGLLL